MNPKDIPSIQEVVDVVESILADDTTTALKASAEAIKAITDSNKFIAKGSDAVAVYKAAKLVENTVAIMPKGPIEQREAVQGLHSVLNALQRSSAAINEVLVKYDKAVFELLTRNDTFESLWNRSYRSLSNKSN